MRGFTLLELMVVVLIIAILAAVAVPTLTSRIRNARTREAANQVAMLYTNARLHAMGRGAAVLVRYDQATNSIEVREAVSGAANGCALTPVSTCNNAWDAPPSGLPRWNRIAREAFDNGAYNDVKLDVLAGTTTQATIDLCFTPMGRAYVRSAFTGAFAVYNAPLTAEVYRFTSGAQEGLRRRVVLLPSGGASVLLATDP